MLDTINVDFRLRQSDFGADASVDRVFASGAGVDGVATIDEQLGRVRGVDHRRGAAIRDLSLHAKERGRREGAVREMARDAIDPPPYDVAAFAEFYRAENEKWGPLAREVIGVEK